MFSKLLVADRGEIAIRAFRAAYELGADTVVVFPYEDRNSVHRLKADEAAIVAAPAHTEYDTGLDLAAVCDVEPSREERSASASAIGSRMSKARTQMATGCWAGWSR